MSPQYLHLRPGKEPPELAKKPYRFVIVAEEEVSDTWRNKVAEWIYTSGARYVVSWGLSCEEWHDSVDWANLEAFDFGDIPDKDHIMTTWHNDEPLSEAFWFAGFCAEHPDVELDGTIILHVSEEARRDALLEHYRRSQVEDDGA